jgi:hypothetical protein
MEGAFYGAYTGLEIKATDVPILTSASSTKNMFRGVTDLK